MNIFEVAQSTFLGLPVGEMFVVTAIVITQPIVYVPLIIIIIVGVVTFAGYRTPPRP